MMDFRLHNNPSTNAIAITISGFNCDMLNALAIEAKIRAEMRYWADEVPVHTIFSLLDIYEEVPSAFLSATKDVVYTNLSKIILFAGGADQIHIYGLELKSMSVGRFFSYDNELVDLAAAPEQVLTVHKELELQRRRLGALATVPPKPAEVIFHDPATIVYWKDGTKTVVKCGSNDTYSKETGLALCYMKKIHGNKGNYNDIFRKWIKEGPDECNE